MEILLGWVCLGWGYVGVGAIGYNKSYHGQLKSNFFQLQKMNKNSCSEGFVDQFQLKNSEQQEGRQHEPKLQNDEKMSFMIQFPERTLHHSQKKTSNSVCSRKQSAKNSTAKYREKKKKELTDLEQSVKELEGELVDTDNQIQLVKQRILTALETLAKMNQRTSNENIEIYNQLQSLMGKSDATQKQKKQYYESFVDFDKINLLLDTLKYRIGANGKERQSKLTYHYKSIVNTLFPALYRYILFSSMYKLDIFDETNTRYPEWEWTKEMVNKLDIQPDQVQSIQKYKGRLLKVYEGTHEGLDKLNLIRERLRQEGLKIEGIEQQIRQIINPIQCAHWILFSQKYKYRREIMLELGFFQSAAVFKREEDELGENKGRKRVKLSNQ